MGLEYFCFAGDELWEMDDDKLVELGMRELEQLGLAKRDMLEFGFATRVPEGLSRCTTWTTRTAIAAIRGWLDGIENLQQVGRNGLHRYNNSDHSMLTAMRAVDNLVKGTDHDIWAVNAESAYHETEEQDEQQPYIEAPETEAQKEPLHQLTAAIRHPRSQSRPVAASAPGCGYAPDERCLRGVAAGTAAAYSRRWLLSLPPSCSRSVPRFRPAAPAQASAGQRRPRAAARRASAARAAIPPRPGTAPTRAA